MNRIQSKHLHEWM